MRCATIVIGMAMSAVVLGDARVQEPEWDAAWRVRGQLGLSPLDLAAMNVPPDKQRLLAAGFRAIAASPEFEGTLLEDLAEAQGEVGRAVSRGREAREAFSRVRSRRTELIEHMQPIAQAFLWTESRDDGRLLQIVLRVSVNAGIDSPCRLLDLTDEQREQILARQEDRDRILRDARQWHRTNHLESVRARFRDDVRALLTERQLTELTELEANIEENLAAVWAIELEGYRTEDDRSAGKLDLPRMAKQLLADAREAVQELRAAAGRFSGWLSARQPESPPRVARATALGPDLGG